MNEKLYGLYSGEELVYIGKVEDTATAMCVEQNLHLHILENGGRHENYMYEYLLSRHEQGERIYTATLYTVPDIDVETVRLALVYSLRPLGNWHEWHWLEEQEEQQNIKTEG